MLRRSAVTLALVAAAMAAPFTVNAQAPPDTAAKTQAPLWKRAGLKVLNVSMALTSRVLEIGTPAVESATRAVDASTCGTVPLTPGCERYVRYEADKLAKPYRDSLAKLLAPLPTPLTPPPPFNLLE
jgi:hypothetical protein